jgi:SAM-dependent methyltransferase
MPEPRGECMSALTERLVWKLKPRAPASLVQAVKAARSGVDPLGVALYRLRCGERRPIPPWELRKRVGAPTIQAYFEAGAECGLAIEAALRQAGKPLGDCERVLDFGCGCGRTLQHLHGPGPPQLHGCDTDAAAIAWMDRAFPDLELTVSGSAPSLPYASDQFDAIYAVSVFTHLDAPQQHAWLAELRRVLRPTGIGLFSIQAGHALRGWWWGGGLTPAAADRINVRGPRLEEDGFFFEPYEDLETRPERFPGVENAYGLSFQSHDWTRTAWSSHFEVLDILPGALNSFQDLVVLREA